MEAAVATTVLVYTEEELAYPLHHALREYIETLKLENNFDDSNEEVMQLLTRTFMTGAYRAIDVLISGVTGTYATESVVSGDTGDETELAEETGPYPFDLGFSAMQLLEEASNVIHQEDDSIEDEDLDETETEKENDQTD